MWIHAVIGRNSDATEGMILNSQAKMVSKRIENETVIDLSLDESKRPLAGRDIDRFRARHRLSISDVSYALALQSTAAYGKACRMPMMPVAREVLVRLYNQYPNPPPWRELTPAEAFTLLYGDILEQWTGTPQYDDARIVLYGRFTALFGRSVYNAYRWIEQEGNAKAEIGRILAKATTLSKPRETLEAIAGQVLLLRGVDLDGQFPVPTQDNPPSRHVRGRKPGQKAKIKTLKAVKVSKVEPAKKVHVHVPVVFVAAKKSVKRVVKPAVRSKASAPVAAKSKRVK